MAEESDDLLGETTGAESSLSPYVGAYATGMLGEGWAASDLPYEAYTGPLTAGESDLQTKAFEGLAGLTIPTEVMTSFTGSMADPTSVNMYMNPYLQNVLDPQLKELRRQAPLHWKQKYNDELKYLITFVAGGNNGAVYKADNWKMIGVTAGLPKHKSLSMKWHNKEELKKLYVKPTGENKKLIFIKEIK